MLNRLEMVPIARLRVCKSNARTHCRKQIRQIAESIGRFGFNNPVLVDGGNEVIAGHGRVEAAKLLGLTEVPALRLSHLSNDEKRAYLIADNRLAELAGWDHEILAIELQGLLDLDFDLELTGFQMTDVEIVRNVVKSPRRRKKACKGDRNELSSVLAVSRAGDVWLLGAHQLCCGDSDDSYAAVDAAVRGWQSTGGQDAVLADTGQIFAEVEKERAGMGSANEPSGKSRAITREAA